MKTINGYLLEPDLRFQDPATSTFNLDPEFRTKLGETIIKKWRTLFSNQALVRWHRDGKLDLPLNLVTWAGVVIVYWSI